MSTLRLLPPVNVQFQTLTVNGRVYSSTPGHVVDAPDFDAGQLRANGWVEVSQVGATSARPANPSPGAHFMDTTVGSIIVFDGQTWRSPASGSSV
jgi:hypothetical protein